MMSTSRSSYSNSLWSTKNMTSSSSSRTTSRLLQRRKGSAHHDFTTTSSTSSSGNSSSTRNHPSSILKVATLKESLQSCYYNSSSNNNNNNNCEDSSLEDNNTVTTAELSCSDSNSYNNMTTTTANRRISAVRFSDVSIRLYPVAPSDNPSVSSSGPAMALGGWKYAQEEAVDLDEYEALQVTTTTTTSTAEEEEEKKEEEEEDSTDNKTGTERARRRASLDHIRLTSSQRQKRLVEHGATPRALKASSRAVFKGQRAREATLQEWKRHQRRSKDAYNQVPSLETTTDTSSNSRSVAAVKQEFNLMMLTSSTKKTKNRRQGHVVSRILSLFVPQDQLFLSSDEWSDAERKQLEQEAAILEANTAANSIQFYHPPPTVVVSPTSSSSSIISV